MKVALKTNRNQILICIALIVVTLISFWNVLNSDFVKYDDNLYVTENPHVQNGINPESVRWALTTGYEAMWQPLTWLSYMLDYQMHGLNPYNFHLTNLLFHIVNVLLLFLLLKRMTGSLWRSAFVAAIFAVHPLRVESVAWVAERKDVLSGFFWLTTMWAYIWYIKKPGVKRYLVVAISYMFGLMSKPMLVTLPFVLFLMDYWPLCRIKLDETHLKIRQTTYKLATEKIPLILMAIASSVITLVVQSNVGAINTLKTPITQRIANAFVSYIVYLKKMIWPNDLAVLYPHPQNTLPVWQVIISALLLMLITIIILRKAKRVPFAAVGWFWYLITLVPVIGILQTGIHAYADRFTYIPLIGISIIIAWGVPELIKRFTLNFKYLAVVGLILIISLAFVTRTQVSYWKDSITLFEHALAVTQNNYMMHYNLATTLEDNGDFDKAIYHYNNTIEINPSHLDARNNMGSILASQGKKEEAMNQFNKIISIDPKFYKAYYNIGLVMVLDKNINDATKYFKKALQMNPKYPPAHNNLVVILYQQGKYAQAWEQVRIAHKQGIVLDPELIELLSQHMAEPNYDK